MATKTVINTDMVNINQENLFKKVEFPYVVPVEDLKHINPYIKSLFKCAVSRKVKKFIENQKILTNDSEILSLVEGYAIPLHKISRQINIPNPPKLKSGKSYSCAEDIKQGSHCRYTKPLGRGIYQQYFSRTGKRWGEPTSNKLQTPKSVHI